MTSGAGVKPPPGEKARPSNERQPDGAGPALLPDRTSDEADLVSPTPDEWYEQERPPHHE